ncbi:MAG: polyphosphate polymerase domain-containing protein [Clostridia bacterium]|nr:polyphosphate polymerase domain-containing protein [Clostridia bacterium]
MCGSACVFERNEKKFLVTAAREELLTPMLNDFFVPDMHGEATIYSLYFDTPDFRLIRQSLERPVYKEKMRLRSYGMPDDDTEVFLELKKKYKGRVYKRRIEFSYSQIKDFLLHGGKIPGDSQITREIEYFMHFYGNIAPRVLVCYDRSAYFAKEDSNIRITFDKQIRYRFTDVLPDKGDSGELLLPKDMSVMEIKFYHSVPQYVSDALTSLGIFPHSFSKYGAAYNTELLRRHSNA